MSMKKIIFALFITLISISLFPARIFAQAIDPQYIFVRKAPDICLPSDCSMLWNMAIPNRSFTEGIDEIVTKVGSLGTNQRKLGVGVLFYYNRQTYDFNTMQQSLRNLLSTAQTKNIPLFIALDGFQWWDGRPDLYNNPSNVEWTCNSNLCAVSKAWRNWGSEFEVSPHPNLASRTFIEDSKTRLKILLPIIVSWYQKLPANKKWLLGGISLGVETDIGGNYYYYKNGTSTGKGLTDSTQLGYAAVNTLGLPGGITSSNLNEIIRRYSNELDKLAYDTGIPRSKIFNHIGGIDISPNPAPSGLVFPTTDGAISTYANPGWSFYGSVTGNPQNFSGLTTTLNKVNNAQWASPEWNTYAGDYQSYVSALKGSLNFRNNRFINISNWEEIRDKPYKLTALKAVLSDSSSCWVSSPSILSVTVSGANATLTWQKGTNNDAVYLIVSSVGEFNTAGVLASAYLVNESVTNKNSYTINNLTTGTYYWELVADGCNSTSLQRKIVDDRFVIGAAPTPTKASTATPKPSPTYVPKSTNTPYPTQKPALQGDIASSRGATPDGHVDSYDVNFLVSNFGKTGSVGFSPADINRDGKVNIFDYSIVVENFGK